MTARMDGRFGQYVDYVDIALEALQTAPRELFEKMVRFLIDQFHQREIELQRLSLELDDMHGMPIEDLDGFYDVMQEGIDDIRLFKRKLETIRTQAPILSELYNQADRLHTAMVQYMDRMGQLEVRILHEQRRSA